MIEPRHLWSVSASLLVASLALQSGVLAAKEKDEAGKEKEEGLPLETTRRIELTVDEGTWLSLDVAPDGRIVFELLGDLYTLPAEGGEATRITEGPAFDSQPAFSPDGEWIAFLSDRDGAENVWIAKADGSEPKKLSQDTRAELASPEWSAAGDYVFASRVGPGFGTFEIWMYHVQGGSGIQVTKSGAPEAPRPFRRGTLGVTAAPDGRYIYYAAKTGGFQYNATFPMWQIARRDMVTGDEDTLTQAPGSAIRPVVSPDGRLLLYGTRFDAATGLRLRDLETGEDRWLLYPVQRDDQESRFTRDLLPGYSFTPDGTAVVLAVDGRIRRVALADGAVTEVPFTADASQELGPLLSFEQRVEEGPVRARVIQAPEQSPDGARLAFSALTRLWVMDLPDGEPRRLTAAEEREFQPTWSPDGRWIAYVTWSSEGGHVWKVPADGGVPQRLTDAPAFYSDPVFSPDGSRIVALRASAFERLHQEVDFGVTGMDVVWLPVEGGEVHLVIPARGVGSPHFAADPERIYAYLLAGGGFGEGPHGLVSFRFDGSDRRTHVRVTGPGLYFSSEPVPANDLRVSRDGKWVLAHVRNQLWVAAVPPLGGEAPTVDVGGPSVPLAKLTEVGADYFDWSADGETITWAVGSTFYRQPFSTVEFEAPETEDEGEGKEKKEKKKKEDEDGEPEEPPLWEAFEAVVEVPRHVPEGTIVLTGARIVTMNGEEVVEDGTVVVTGNRIAAVGRADEVEVPAGARVEELSGKTIVPGFVDTHAHWFEIRRGVLDVENWSFLANLAYGVTTGLDVQTMTNDMFAYQDLVDAGEILGPRAYSTGPGVFSDNDFEDLDQAKAVLEKYRDHYRTRNLKSYEVGNRKQRQLVAQAARELGMMPTTEGALDLKKDLTHVLDGFTGNEHALPIVPLFDDVVELVAKSGTAYTPTLLVAYGGPWAENFFYTGEEVHDDEKLRRFVPHEVLDAKTRRRPWFREDEHVFDELAAQAAKILRAGGKIGVGSHGQLQGLGYHWELEALATAMTPMEVLRCATIGGAEIIGFADDLGTLEPGKLADLLVLDADPREDIRATRAIHRVMKNGELFDAATLDRLWPVEEPLPAMWWQGEGLP